MSLHLSYASARRYARPALIVALLSACSSEHDTPAKGEDPVPVRVIAATQENLPVQLKALGTVTPLNSVTVRSRVDGELVRVLFEEGQVVKQGQLLAEIDPRPYQVALAQADGTLRENEVQLQNAEIEEQRLQDLLKQNFVSKQSLTNQQAQTRQLRARLITLQAAVDSAKLQLAYTRIQAPISGRLGLRKVDRGNLIRSGDTEGLVSITQTQPISVVFTVPETEVADLLDARRQNGSLKVEAWDRSERRPLANGTLASLDNQIDTATGTLKLKAAFTNDDGRLFPNQFVNVRLHVREIDQAVVIPNASVQYGAQGNYVFVVGDDGKVTIRPVVLGASNDDRLVITRGLMRGERVVLEGLDRLREGREVQIIADTPPAAAHASPIEAGASAKAAP